jgi:hypothetical protein
VSGLSRLMVGGMVRVSMALIAAMASSPPAAPSVWPVAPGHHAQRLSTRRLMR